MDAESSDDDLLAASIIAEREPLRSRLALFGYEEGSFSDANVNTDDEVAISGNNTACVLHVEEEDADAVYSRGAADDDKISSAMWVLLA